MEEWPILLIHKHVPSRTSHTIFIGKREITQIRSNIRVCTSIQKPRLSNRGRDIMSSHGSETLWRNIPFISQVQTIIANNRKVAKPTTNLALNPHITRKRTIMIRRCKSSLRRGKHTSLRETRTLRETNATTTKIGWK